MKKILPLLLILISLLSACQEGLEGHLEAYNSSPSPSLSAENNNEPADVEVATAVIIPQPAGITVMALPDDIFKLEMVDKGYERIHKYDVYPMLYDFVGSSFCGKSFEVIDSVEFPDYEALQNEIDRIRKENQCVVINLVSSGSWLQITPAESSKESPTLHCLTIAKNPREPGTYTLITDTMAYDVRVDINFDEGFDTLFSKNGTSGKYLSPDEVKSIFEYKKPYYMEYICKNLGISEWYGREPNRLEIKKMTLNSESKPYTVVSIYSTFSLRMLVYKENSTDHSLCFIGDMDFRGWPNDPEYHFVRTGDQIWVAGIKYLGHGTGQSFNSQQWYRVTDAGVKSVLLFSFNDYSEGPDGGYSVNAKNVSVQNNGSIEIKVNYDTSKRYNLFLDIADEYGSVELKDSKTVKFIWNETQERFLSEYEADEDGAFTILADSAEMTEKCDELLEKRYEEMDTIISAIPDEENEHERTWRAASIRTYLNDCTDCEHKAELLKKLTELFPEKKTY